MKRNVTYLKLFILINISNLYSFKFNKTTTKIFFNDILNFCKKNKKLTCFSIPIVLSIGILNFCKKNKKLTCFSIPIVLSIGRLIYKKSEFYKLKKIENYKFFQIIKKRLNIVIIQNKNQDKTNVEQIESYNINCSAYKFHIGEFIEALSDYNSLKNRCSDLKNEEEGLKNFKLKAFNLKDKVIKYLNNILKIEGLKGLSEVDEKMVANFVEDFEKADHEFQDKIMYRINEMFSLDNKKSI